MRALLQMICSFFLALLAAGVSLATAADDPHAADRQALIRLFREMEASINAQDVERMVAQMHPQATVTWLNGEVSRGHDEIRAYYQRMVKGDQRILDRYLTTAKLGASARFFGNGEVAVADGTMVDEFFPVARGPFRLDSNWTSTSAKIDGRWQVVALHLSANVFTNSLMAEAQSAIRLAAGGAALGGLLLGALLTWLWCRRGAQSARSR
ncbi:MAG TPA: nuclear transport factor 2 family protein [Accumulibacter sp.]|uniref:nuclear transport factor 2 family protein n=1 Tax=Accumulibacter sp. TaxID=2053492 RepID=UPI002C82F7DE|nr:nuclear transport factor 2 family protein [Accumulibacter sp.]HMV05316.1 nuclear transport factor 2 family protein [Accumulibacter sp.]HMW63848.1 nuclear transport factor 2 family protein [Accumulibacter sp.]HMW80505.1 nuclear transport factor 2 family protein [Accumulibacter sp.]HMX68514.1 nuclear transport factor 2 family protein [Accumulibacter sp.]HNB68093.1 nuclear transport factor 2 family protein [Accumulibacter sp.]